MYVEVVYVAYSQRLVKDAGALYLTFAMPTRSSEIMIYVLLYNVNFNWERDKNSRAATFCHKLGRSICCCYLPELCSLL